MRALNEDWLFRRVGVLHGILLGGYVRQLRLTRHGVLDRHHRRLVVVLVDFRIVFGLPVNEHAAHDDEVVRQVLRDDVGRSAVRDRTGNGFLSAFRTTAKGGIDAASDLGSLGSYPSIAFAINASGQAVGYSFTADSPDLHAFFADATGPMVDLNTLIDPASGWVLTSANGINDSGQIAGTGTINGQTHAYLLSVPEPASLSLLALGGIALFRRTRHR